MTSGPELVLDVSLHRAAFVDAPCRIRIWCASDVPEHRPVVLVEPTADGDGLPSDGCWPALSAWVRAQLPASAQSPVWLERWQERAVAAVLMDRPGVTELMVVSDVSGPDRDRSPFRRKEFEELTRAEL
jgi:hypothetical protein